MAPPMSPSRPRRTPVRHRSPADLLLGLAAVAALAALTAGVPFALVTVFGLPIPHSLPRLGGLNHPLDVHTILSVLSVLVWLAWIQLVWCVAAEIRAAVRNTGMPARVPLAGGTQALVHRLVTTALLLSAATTALSPAFTANRPVAAAPRPAATAAPHPGHSAAAPHQPAPHQPAPHQPAPHQPAPHQPAPHQPRVSHRAPPGHAEPPAPGTRRSPAAAPPWEVGRPHLAPANPARPSGARPPQAQSPASQSPGSQSPGSQSPGSQSPGSQSPGSQSPGSQAGGGQSPGHQPGGGRGSASKNHAPGRHAPGHPGHAPGSQAPGAAAPGGGPSPAPVVPGPGMEKIYVVQPPVGRFHESLWEIAAKFLGDGRRYREIFQLNSGQTQPDGTRLTIASLIRPGWVLRLPADAQGPGIELARPAARGSEPVPPGGTAQPASPSGAASVSGAASPSGVGSLSGAASPSGSLSGAASPSGVGSPSGVPSPSGVGSPSGAASPSGSPSGVPSPSGLGAVSGVGSPSGIPSPFGAASPFRTAPPAASGAAGHGMAAHAAQPPAAQPPAAQPPWGPARDAVPPAGAHQAAVPPAGARWAAQAAVSPAGAHQAAQAAAPRAGAHHAAQAAALPGGANRAFQDANLPVGGHRGAQDASLPAGAHRAAQNEALDPALAAQTALADAAAHAAAGPAAHAAASPGAHPTAGPAVHAAAGPAAHAAAGPSAHSTAGPAAHAAAGPSARAAAGPSAHAAAGPGAHPTAGPAVPAAGAPAGPGAGFTAHPAAGSMAAHPAAGPPGPAGPAAHLAAVAAHPASRWASAAPPASDGVVWPAGLSYPRDLAAASLLATGLLAALGRRRREQWWQRAFGRRIAGPYGAAALAEAALRSGADEPSALLLDAGLRYLAWAFARSGRTPPTVLAAHLSPASLDLWVDPADHDPPAPWASVGDGQVWRLPAAALGRIVSAQVAAAGALYPGLVSIGTDHSGRVLVNLEAANGVIAVTGPAEVVTAALSGIALELATSRWSDEMQLTLAGFGGELVSLAPDRIIAVPAISDALPLLAARAAAVATELTAAGIGSVLEGRATGTAPAAWAPHYLISAIPPTPAEARQLLSLARSSPAAGASYLVAGEVPGAAWAWEVTGDGRLLAGGLGFDVAAQLVPERERGAVADLFDATARAEGVALATPSADAPGPHLDPGPTAAARITVLGPVWVQAPGPVHPDDAELLTEVLVYLALHPGGVPCRALDAAIWPGGVTPGERDAALDRAAEWLGTDSIGRPHLAADAAGRLRIGPGVRIDWLVFQAHTGQAAAVSPGSEAEAEALGQALDLINGPFLDGRDPGRYAWLALGGLEYEVGAQVADAAHRLAGLCLAAGDAGAAMTAARSGLRLAADDQELWRDLLRAAQATGQPSVLHAVVDEMSQRAGPDGTGPDGTGPDGTGPGGTGPGGTGPGGRGPWLAPETEALIAELCPSWRRAR
jgi:hypothetical protein